MKDGVSSVQPAVSFIMPCYNEEEAIGYTVPRLISAFEEAGYVIELVAVDNGSTDRTGEVIATLADRFPSIVPVRIDVNEGYGNGLLQGIPYCTAAWIGFIPADGQVDDGDVVRLYEALVATNGNVVGKVRRRFRMDGFRRKIVSITYNFLVRMMWPRLDSLDVNGTPKIMPRDVLEAMNLQHQGWLLDPELMVKAHYMGVRILEFNVFARMRGSGVSHVHTSTLWEFIKALLSFRFSKRWRSAFKQAKHRYQNPSRVADIQEKGSAFDLESSQVRAEQQI